MKKISIIIFLAGSLLGSCKKFLQQPPYNNISKEDIFSDFEGARTTIVGCYDMLKSTSYYLRDFYMYPEITGGNVKYSNLANPQLYYSYNFTQDSVNNDMAGFYKTAYTIIYSANNILENINKVTDANLYQKNRLLADAYSIRALVNFDLVRTFAQPYSYTADASHPGIILKTKNNAVTDLPAAPSSVKIVYQQIIQDLDSALLHYGNSTNIYIAGSEKTWMSADAAKALLCRVSLYTGDWQTVIDVASDLIGSNKYPLLTNSKYVSSWLGKNISSESIFELAFGNRTGGSLGDYFNSQSTLYCQFSGSNDLLSLFDPGDIRGSSNMFVTQYINGNPYYFSRKYQGVADSANNIKLLRSSELYLNRAEAYAQMNQPDLALPDLNKIRKRANPSDPGISLTDPQEILDEIAKERRREFCFEGQLFFDIARNKKDLIRNDCSAQICGFSFPSPFYACPKPIYQ